MKAAVLTSAGREEARVGPLRTVWMSGQAVEDTGRQRQEWGVADRQRGWSLCLPGYR